MNFQLSINKNNQASDLHNFYLVKLNRRGIGKTYLIEKFHLEAQVEHLINKIKQHLSVKGCKDLNFDAIQLPFEIDEKLLARFILILEKKTTPLGYFICGLLLEGRINNVAEEEKASNPKYIEKRSHDAITFYLKSADDPKLRPFVSFILWEIKTTTEFVSIQRRLAEYDLIPPPDYINSYDCYKKPQTAITSLVNEYGIFSKDTQEKKDGNIEHITVEKRIA